MMVAIVFLLTPGYMTPIAMTKYNSTYLQFLYFWYLIFSFVQ